MNKTKSSIFVGVEKFCGNINSMIGKKPNKYFRICWKYITPTVGTVSKQTNKQTNTITKNNSYNFELVSTCNYPQLLI